MTAHAVRPDSRRRRELAPGHAPVAGLPAGAGRVDPAGGGPPLGRPHRLPRPRRRADLHRAGPPARTPSPGWLADHGIGRGDVVAVHIPNCRQYPPLYYGILLAGATFSPTNPLLPAPDLAAQLTDAGATRARHLGPGAALRPRRPRADPGADRRRHRRGAHPRLRRPAGRPRGRPTSTSPTCSAPTPPTGASTPTSTRRPTSRTSPTPAGRPASARASSCRTATSSPTCCSRRAGPAARCRSWTRPAT